MVLNGTVNCHLGQWEPRQPISDTMITVALLYLRIQKFELFFPKVSKPLYNIKVLVPTIKPYKPDHYNMNLFRVEFQI